MAEPKFHPTALEAYKLLWYNMETEEMPIEELPIEKMLTEDTNQEKVNFILQCQWERIRPTGSTLTFGSVFDSARVLNKLMVKLIENHKMPERILPVVGRMKFNDDDRIYFVGSVVCLVDMKWILPWYQLKRFSSPVKFDKNSVNGHPFGKVLIPLDVDKQTLCNVAEWDMEYLFNRRIPR